MPFSDINVGTVPNDGTGDSLKVAGEAINANFDKAVEGPVSSVDSNLVAFDGVTGKLVKDSGVASSAFATAAQGSLADTATQPGDDADTLGSGAATDGHVLTADGVGGAAWEAVAAGGDVEGPASAVNDNIATFDGTTGKVIQDGGKPASAIPTIDDLDGPGGPPSDGSFALFVGETGTLLGGAGLGPSSFVGVWGGTFTGEVAFQSQVRTTPGADLGTTGTLTLDASGASLRSTGALTGNITFATSNLAAGRSVTVRVVNGATERTLSFPAGWRFVGAKPTSILASKVGTLTVTAFGTTDADVVAAWAVEE